MRKIILIIALLVFPVVCLAQETKSQATPVEKKETMNRYFERYTGKEAIPEDLYLAYKRLIEAFSSENEDKIKRYCLPHSITIEVGQQRPSKAWEYGGMNIAFLKHGFSPEILVIVKESQDSYLLRTGSSGLRFVETKNDGWKLYYYFDKPIQ